MNTKLKGKIVLVTGASGGIGSAIARAFAREQAKLVLHYHSNRQAAEQLRHDLKAANPLLVQADLTNEKQTSRLFQKACAEYGGVDTLVANAGTWEMRDVPLQEMSLRQWRATLDGVLTSTFLCVREFFRLVVRQRRGNAVLIGSTAAVFGEAGHADYAAGKAAMAFGLTRSLKNELARLAPPIGSYCGGRINCVCPGWTIVPRTAAQLQNVAVIRRVASTMALPKLAVPGDIASTVVFLSSDTLAGHVTGQTLVVAGGMEGRQLWQADEVRSEPA